ncbi:hypothetical protein MXB_2469, partial [Myxobolus squamalis]
MRPVEKYSMVGSSRLYFGLTENIKYMKFMDRISPMLETLDATLFSEWTLNLKIFRKISEKDDRIQQFLYILESSECANTVAVITDDGNVMLAMPSFLDIIEKVKDLFTLKQKIKVVGKVYSYSNMLLKFGELNCPCSSTDTFFPVLDSVYNYLDLKNVINFVPRKNHQYKLTKNIDDEAVLSDSFACTCVNYT